MSNTTSNSDTASNDTVENLSTMDIFDEKLPQSIADFVVDTLQSTWKSSSLPPHGNTDLLLEQLTAVYYKNIDLFEIHMQDELFSVDQFDNASEIKHLYRSTNDTDWRQTLQLPPTTEPPVSDDNTADIITLSKNDIPTLEQMELLQSSVAQLRQQQADLNVEVHTLQATLDQYSSVDGHLPTTDLPNTAQRLLSEHTLLQKVRARSVRLTQTVVREQSTNKNIPTRTLQPTTTLTERYQADAKRMHVSVPSKQNQCGS